MEVPQQMVETITADLVFPFRTDSIYRCYVCFIIIQVVAFFYFSVEMFGIFGQMLCNYTVVYGEVVLFTLPFKKVEASIMAEFCCK